MDINPLRTLIAATEKKHNVLRNPGKVNPKARTEVQPQLENTAANRTVITEKTEAQSSKAGFNAGLRLDVSQRVEPVSERLVAVSSDVDLNCKCHV